MVQQPQDEIRAQFREAKQNYLILHQREKDGLEEMEKPLVARKQRELAAMRSTLEKQRNKVGTSQQLGQLQKATQVPIVTPNNRPVVFRSLSVRTHATLDGHRYHIKSRRCGRRILPTVRHFFISACIPTLCAQLIAWRPTTQPHTHAC
eukprot:COSAG05_NODE_3982_length_1740_cov_1.569165_1_plen_149_part_00